MRQPHALSGGDVDAPSSDLDGEPPCDDASFLVLEVVQVQRRSLAMRRQRSLQRENRLSASIVAPELEDFARVPVVQSKDVRWHAHGRLDAVSSQRFDRRRQLDSVSSHGGDPATRRRICEAALRLIAARRGADVTLAEVARAARVSRQALYLHFADRADLFVALVRYADEQRGMTDAITRVQDAPSGTAALRELAAMQARMNPAIWPLARLIDAVRRQNDAAEQSWKDRLASRLRGCRAIVARLEKEGSLRRGLDAGVAVDLLWSLTSLRVWEDLVLLRRWSATQYEGRLLALLMRALVTTRGTPAPRSPARSSALRSRRR